jgi:hypothetical protein
MPRVNNATNEDILNDIVRIYKENGNKIGAELFKKSNPICSYSYVQKRFGSWNNALKLANINTFEKRSSNEITKELIIEDICRVYSEYGVVSKSTYKRYGEYHYKSVLRRFGSWNNAMTESKLEVNQRPITDEEIFQELHRLYRKHNTINAKILIDDSCYSIHCFTRIGGTLNKTLEIADIPVENPYGQSKSGEIAIAILEEILGENAEKEKKFDWLRNPKTNMPLSIDAYFPNSGLCVEYHGAQHYQFIAHFHRTEKEFRNSVQRDQNKKRLILENGLKFLEIHYKEELTVENFKRILMCV